MTVHSNSGGNSTDFDDTTLSGADQPGSGVADFSEKGHTDADRNLHNNNNGNNNDPAHNQRNDTDLEEGLDEDESDEDHTSPATRVASFSFSDVPDGGLQAWLVVAGVWCTSFCSFGWINSVGSFQEYYEAGPLKQYSSSTISWIPSLQIFFMMAMGPIVGKLFDAYGPRWMILIGSLMHVFGLMMASLAHTYYQFLLSQGVCSAIGVSAIFQPALSCIPGWFNKNRGIAYGALASGSSIGGVIFPIMVSRLIKSAGYGWAMRASAFLILGLLTFAVVTVRSRLHSHPHFKANRSKAKAEAAAAGNSRARQMLHPFTERGFLFLTIGAFLLTFGIYVPITFIPVQAIATGNVTQDLAQYLVAIFNAGSLFGRLTSGWASDKIGKYNAFCISCYASGILVLALWIPGTNQGSIIAFAVLFGYFSGAYVSLIPSLVAQISPHKEIGYRTGLVFLTCSVPGLVTSPISGAILAESNWINVKVYGGVMLLAGTVAVTFCRLNYTGLKLLKAF